MESSVDSRLGNEALRLYLSEVKNTTHDFEFDEQVVLDESEQAADFLQKAGLADLSKLYHEGTEITESVLDNTVKNINLTEAQVKTIKSRVKTLNKTLHSKQPKRKPRQDIRDVAWNAENSSTGIRSRSATPDSLDSIGGINDDLTSDEDRQLSTPSLSVDSGHVIFKGKLKWTSSEPLHNKFNRGDRGDVAHLGSENVILKGYQPLSENSTLTRRERSGSDPTIDTHNPIDNHNSSSFRHEAVTIHSKLSRSHNSLLVSGANNPLYIINSEPVSFEGLLRKNEEMQTQQENMDFSLRQYVSINEINDSLYQQLKPLLWVEVTAIFDQYKISVLKRKAPLRSKRGNVFGVNLACLIMRDMPQTSDTSMVPQIFQCIINHLNTRLTEDGILRMAGQQQKLNFLCNEIETKFYNNREAVENMLNQASVHDLTGILKKLLRDLPETMFTMELFDMFYKCSMISSPEDQFIALNLLVLLLPVEYRNTFHLLLGFCINVIKHQEQNRMTLHNVAMITAPSFFSPRLLLPKENGKINLKSIKSLPKEELAKHINGAAVSCFIMEQILKSGDSLWIVPNRLAQQAREALQRVHDRKESAKEKRLRYDKKKLHRSSTQYEVGNMVSPRIRKCDLYV